VSERDAIQTACAHLWQDGWCSLCGIGFATYAQKRIDALALAHREVVLERDTLERQAEEDRAAIRALWSGVDQAEFESLYGETHAAAIARAERAG
jgi:hypothetical protein